MSKWGLLRGAGQGVAQAGNMLMADRLDQAKEERLQKYQQSMQERQFAREDQVRAEDRNEREVQNAQNLSLRANENIQAQANWDAEHGLRQEQHGLLRKQDDRAGEEHTLRLGNLQQTARQIEQTLEMGGLELAEQRQLQGLRDVIANPDAEPDAISRAITTLNGLKGQNPEKYQAITMYGDENDMGVQPRSTGVLNQSTGQITPAGIRGGASVSNIPQAAIDMLARDPSPEAIAEFEDVFGAGSAAQYLR